MDYAPAASYPSLRDKSQTRYQYQTLEPSSRQIRRLILLPGPAGSPVRVEIEVCGLPKKSEAVQDGEGYPIYEALSYVWGPTEKSETVLVGVAGNAALPIAHNLATALPYLRNERCPRPLWIDAICIDQANIQERSEQVRLMGDIYSVAARVIVWLGPCDGSYERAFLILQKLYEQADFDFRMGRTIPWPDLVSIPEDFLDLDAADLHAITALLDDSWFTRLWIWQEICLANTNALLQSGRSFLKWERFGIAISHLDQNEWDSPLDDEETECLSKLLRNAYDLIYCCETHAYTVITLPELIEITSMVNCSDPKDRIYALLAMLKYNEFPIIPDYSKSLKQVYRDAVVHMIQTNNRLSILGHCNIRNRIAGWPTWVPNYSVAGILKRARVCYASGTSAAEVHLTGGLLQLVGRHVDRVLRVVMLPRKVKEVIEIIVGLMSYHGICISHPGENTALRSLFELLYDKDRHLHGDSRVTARYNENKKLFSEFVMNPSDHNLERAMESSEVFRKVLDNQNSSLVLTQKGYIGIATCCVEISDEVCAFLGNDDLLLLRPSESEHYQLVGPAIGMEGLTCNEAFLGPLPQDWDWSFRISERSLVCLCYINIHTGAITSEDPRLAKIPLPAGWGRLAQEDGVWNKFTHGSLAEGWTFSDPRLSSRELRKRGTETKTFNIV